MILPDPEMAHKPGAIRPQAKQFQEGWLSFLSLKNNYLVYVLSALPSLLIAPVFDMEPAVCPP